MTLNDDTLSDALMVTAITPAKTVEEGYLFSLARYIKRGNTPDTIVADLIISVLTTSLFVICFEEFFTIHKEWTEKTV